MEPPTTATAALDSAFNDRYELHAVVVESSDAPGGSAVEWVDASMMTQLEVAAFSSAGGKSLLSHEQFEESRRGWDELLNNARRTESRQRQYDALHLLIAKARNGDVRDQELAGIASGRIEGDGDTEYHVDLIAVLPRFARRGGSQLLLSSIERSLRRRGAAAAPSIMTLSVERDNASAQSAYRRFGFRTVPWPPTWPQQSSATHVAMIKEIGGDAVVASANAQ